MYQNTVFLIHLPKTLQFLLFFRKVHSYEREFALYQSTQFSPSQFKEATRPQSLNLRVE